MYMDNLKKLLEQLNEISKEVEQSSESTDFNTKTVFDDLFSNHPLFDGGLDGSSSPLHELLFDVSETDENVVVVVDLPGFTEDQISIQSDELQVRVSAEATEDMRRESVSHSFRLPTEVVPSEAEATFENGVLEITLPRVEQEDDATSIDIS